MGAAFWDTSCLVPLCVQQSSTSAVEALSRQYRIVVWWEAPVEVRGALARLIRMGQLTSKGQTQALIVLDKMRRNWQEVYPDDPLRERAESLVERFPLTAGDALQLAAALTWCIGHPRNRPFVAADAQLLEAAQQLGFRAIQG